MKKQMLFVLWVGLIAVGCSSRSVNFDYDRSADFSSFKTYAWHDGELSIKEEDPLGHQRIMDAVDRQMSAKGFSKVSSNPDVYVTYNGEDNEQVRMDTTHMGYDYGPDWYWGGGFGMDMGTSTTQVRTYLEGTLVVDIWDANKKQLVWRGVGSDIVSDNPESNAKKIDKMVADMFKRYPPK
jgi:hypothetical protein